MKISQAWTIEPIKSIEDRLFYVTVDCDLPEEITWIKPALEAAGFQIRDNGDKLEVRLTEMSKERAYARVERAILQAHPSNKDAQAGPSVQVKPPQPLTGDYTTPGWLDPKGNLYPLGDLPTHSAAAKGYFGSSYDSMLGNGWIRISEEGAETGRGVKLSGPQWAFLEDMIFTREDALLDIGGQTIAVENSDFVGSGQNLKDYLSSTWKAVGSLKKTANDPVKKTIKMHGTALELEWLPGETRKYKSGFEQEMSASYGFVKGTEGEDGEEVDVYVGTELDSECVVKITQLNEEGEFDEYKYIVGFEDPEAAVQCYKNHMPDDRFGGSRILTWLDFENDLAEASGDETLEEETPVDKTEALAKKADSFHNEPVPGALGNVVLIFEAADEKEATKKAKQLIEKALGQAATNVIVGEVEFDGKGVNLESGKIDFFYTVVIEGPQDLLAKVEQARYPGGDFATNIEPEHPSLAEETPVDKTEALAKKAAQDSRTFFEAFGEGSNHLRLAVQSLQAAKQAAADYNQEMAVDELTAMVEEASAMASDYLGNLQADQHEGVESGAYASKKAALIQELFIVVQPTGKSVLADVSFATDIPGFANQLKGGLDPSTIVSVFDNKEEADQLGQQLLDDAAAGGGKPMLPFTASLEVTAGLSTQVRNLKRRLKDMDTAKCEPREVRDVVDALDVLEKRLESETERKKKQKEDKAKDQVEKAKAEPKKEEPKAVEKPKETEARSEGVPPLAKVYTKAQWAEKAGADFANKTLYTNISASHQIEAGFDKAGQLKLKVATSDGSRMFDVAKDMDVLYFEDSGLLVNASGDDISWDQLADSCIEAYFDKGPDSIAAPVELSPREQLSALI